MSPRRWAQPVANLIVEAIGMQANAELVGAEPRPGRHDIAEGRQHGHAAFLYEAGPAGVQDQSVPDDDQQRAVLLGIPAPETAPRLIGPDAAQHGAGEAQQRREANDAVDRVGQGLRWHSC